MSPGSMVRRAWRSFERFAYAMEQDPHTELERRVTALEWAQPESRTVAPQAVGTGRDSRTD